MLHLIVSILFAVLAGWMYGLGCYSMMFVFGYLSVGNLFYYIESTKKPTKEDIGKLAHQIWLDRGKPHGQDTDIWVQAEKELNRRRFNN